MAIPGLDQWSRPDAASTGLGAAVGAAAWWNCRGPFLPCGSVSFWKSMLRGSMYGRLTALLFNIGKASIGSRGLESLYGAAVPLRRCGFNHCALDLDLLSAPKVPTNSDQFEQSRGVPGRNVGEHDDGDA
jgi:hypothetical protein